MSKLSELILLLVASVGFGRLSTSKTLAYFVIRFDIKSANPFQLLSKDSPPSLFTNHNQYMLYSIFQVF